VVDFLLVLTELFSLGVTAEALRANTDWAFLLQRDQLDPKFQVEGAPPTILRVGKTRINVFSCGIRIGAGAEISFIFFHNLRV